MSAADESWRDVAANFRRLGRKLKEHYEEQGGDGADREDLKQAVDAIAEGVEKAFGAMSEALRDPDVREEAKRATSSFASAVGASISELGDEMRKAATKSEQGRNEGGVEEE